MLQSGVPNLDYQKPHHQKIDALLAKPRVVESPTIVFADEIRQGIKESVEEIMSVFEISLQEVNLIAHQIMYKKDPHDLFSNWQNGLADSEMVKIIEGLVSDKNLTLGKSVNGFDKSKKTDLFGRVFHSLMWNEFLGQQSGKIKGFWNNAQNMVHLVATWEQDSNQDLIHVRDTGLDVKRQEKPNDWIGMFDKLKKYWNAKPSINWDTVNYDIADVAVLKAITMIRALIKDDTNEALIIKMIQESGLGLAEFVSNFCKENGLTKAVNLEQYATVADMNKDVLQDFNFAVMMAWSPGGNLHKEEVVAKTVWSNAKLGMEGETKNYSGCTCLIVGFGGEERYVFDLYEGIVLKLSPDKIKQFIPIVAVNLE